jgi:hypothetical protein
MSARAIKREQARKAVRDARKCAKQRGCTCQPEICVVETGRRYPRHLVDLCHDEHCLLMRAVEGPCEPQLITLLREDGSAVPYPDAGAS